jgi:hypothetical protein
VLVPHILYNIIGRVNSPPTPNFISRKEMNAPWHASTREKDPSRLAHVPFLSRPTHCVGSLCLRTGRSRSRSRDHGGRLPSSDKARQHHSTPDRWQAHGIGPPRLELIAQDQIEGRLLRPPAVGIGSVKAGKNSNNDGFFSE